MVKGEDSQLSGCGLESWQALYQEWPDFFSQGLFSIILNVLGATSSLHS